MIGWLDTLTPPTPLHAGLFASIAERESGRGFCREEVPNPGVLLKGGRLDKVKRAWVGSEVRPHVTGCVTVADWRHKLVAPDAWPVPGAELARQYLRTALEPWMGEQRSKFARSRIPFHRQALSFLSVAPPYFFTPPAHDGGEWVHLDITSCYPTIIARLGTVLEYRPGWEPPLLRSVGPEWPAPAEWLQGDKTSLRALYGMLRKPAVVEMRYGKRVEVPRAGRWLSPDLIGALFDTMHAIVGEVVDACPTATAGTVDSLIVRPEDEGTAVALLRDRWGLEYHRKAAGIGTVWGRNTHHIGDGQPSADWRAGKAQQHPADSSLRPVSPRVRELLAARVRGGP